MKWREGRDLSRPISRVCGRQELKTGKSQNITGLYIKLRSLDFIFGVNGRQPEDFQTRTNMDRCFVIVRLTPRVGLG